MANSMILTAMTMIALTGVTLTSLKYRHDDQSNVDFNLTDDGDDDTLHVNPKFQYKLANKSVSKRSSDDRGQYSIDDKNASMVVEMRREKVKQV